MAFRRKSPHRESADFPDVPGPKPGRDPLPADTPAFRLAVRRLAICKLERRRETADRLAEERNEDEEMTVRAG